MRGNVEEKPEIGNVEQITCLQKYIRDHETTEHTAKTIGVDVRIQIIERWDKYYRELRFECVCGKDVVDREYIPSNADEEDDEDDLELLYYEGEVFTCQYCGRKYQMICDKAKLF